MPWAAERASEAMAAGYSEAEQQVRESLIHQIMVQEEIVRRQAPGDLEAWLTTYLPKFFFRSPGWFHRALYSDAEDLLHGRAIDGKKRTAMALACPRGHGKTTAMVIGAGLYAALEWRSLEHFRGRAPYIVIVSDTVDQARARLADIRDQLESNEDLIALYGAQAPTDAEGRKERRQLRNGAGRRRVRKRKWNQSHLELADGTIIRAMGFGSKVRGLVSQGRRPSLLLCDDMENDQAVETDKRRDRLRRWFVRSLIPTGIQGELATIVVGTILHADSLLARLIDKKEHFPGWLKRRYAALTTSDGLPSVSGTVPLWPEFWTRKMLLERAEEIGALAFAQEYLNQPIDDSTTWFRRAWLDMAKQRGKGRGWLYAPPPKIPYSAAVSTWDPVELAAAYPAGAYQVVVTAWDLGIEEDAQRARARDTDYSVGITVGLTADDRLEMRRVWRGRGLTPGQLRGRVISEHDVTGADYIVIERNAAQRLHELELRAIPGLDLPIVPHTTTSKKHSIWDGVPGMALMFELGRIDLCWDEPAERERVDTVANELHGLGLEAHDDTVMALWMATLVIRRWQRKRNTRRLRLLGPSPTGYGANLYPVRPEERKAA